MSKKETDFKKACPESSKILDTISEIKEVMDALGRNENEGDVKGSHLGKILNHLRQEQNGVLEGTASKLALICGMKSRYVKEDYLRGMIEFGIILISTESNKILWKWNGIKAFQRNNGDNRE
jgi:hypothetical protein